MGGAIFHFSQKIGLKTTKNMLFCILHKPMGGLEPPPPPPLATLLSASSSANFGASSFEETAPDAAPDEEKMALRRTLQPNKNAVILKIKKRRSQLPKSIEKMP